MTGTASWSAPSTWYRSPISRKARRSTISPFRAAKWIMSTSTTTPATPALRSRTRMWCCGTSTTKRGLLQSEHHPQARAEGRRGTAPRRSGTRLGDGEGGSRGPDRDEGQRKRLAGLVRTDRRAGFARNDGTLAQSRPDQLAYGNRL